MTLQLNNEIEDEWRQNEIINIFKQLIMQVSYKHQHGGFLILMAMAHEGDFHYWMGLDLTMLY